MPLRASARASGPDIPIFRRLSFGQLAEFHVLDTRQFRSVTKPCGYSSGPECPASLDPTRTMLGDEQERWLLAGLGRSRARWNVLAQQVPFAFVDVGQTAEVAVRHDKWDAYPTARQTIVDFMVARRPGNPVVITGDLHNAWTQVVKADHRDPASRPVATEFVGSSISSGGDGSDQTTTAPAVLAKNPHVVFNSNRRGYVSCEVTPRWWRSEFRAVPFVTTEGAPVATTASFVVESGDPVPHRE
jgi:alkaline phosphatase D